MPARPIRDTTPADAAEALGLVGAALNSLECADHHRDAARRRLERVAAYLHRAALGDPTAVALAEIVDGLGLEPSLSPLAWRAPEVTD
jgi:hypothetical protein